MHRSIPSLLRWFSSSSTKTGKYWARAVYTGGICTGSRLRARGYNTQGLCPHCGDIDTVWHRAWQCPFGATARAEAVPAWMLREALASPSDPLFSHGWVPVPEMLSSPLEEGTFEYSTFDTAGNCIDTSAFFFSSSDGDLYPDGSITHPKSPPYTRPWPNISPS